MLLDYGLSEHLLAELCSRWNPALDEVVKSQGKYEKMKSMHFTVITLRNKK